MAWLSIWCLSIAFLFNAAWIVRLTLLGFVRSYKQALHNDRCFPALPLPTALLSSCSPQPLHLNGPFESGFLICVFPFNKRVRSWAFLPGSHLVVAVLVVWFISFAFFLSSFASPSLVNSCFGVPVLLASVARKFWLQPIQCVL